MDARLAARSEFQPLGDVFVPVIGDGVRPVALMNSSTARVSRARRQRRLALLNAQWRGGSTLAEQLIFSTTIAPPFLLDEPAKAMWLDSNNHKISTCARITSKPNNTAACLSPTDWMAGAQRTSWGVRHGHERHSHRATAHASQGAVLRCVPAVRTWPPLVTQRQLRRASVRLLQVQPHAAALMATLAWRVHATAQAAQLQELRRHETALHLCGQRALCK
jgi:hypothetical protein